MHSLYQRGQRPGGNPPVGGEGEENGSAGRLGPHLHEGGFAKGLRQREDPHRLALRGELPQGLRQPRMMRIEDEEELVALAGSAERLGVLPIDQLQGLRPLPDRHQHADHDAESFGGERGAGLDAGLLADHAGGSS